MRLLAASQCGGNALISDPESGCFNQARRDLTAVLHVHMIHVPTVHLHVVIHWFGLGNLA